MRRTLLIVALMYALIMPSSSLLSLEILASLKKCQAPSRACFDKCREKNSEELQIEICFDNECKREMDACMEGEGL
ncbi:hypothetical protein Q1695_003748 [Nippostrongylus brasiliensis]|nr:hypothetical protein Q1695_003748 [Nippostrongylus brasiliensis]